MVVVLQAHDVVFAEVIAELHFDENEQLRAAVADAVFGFDRDVHMLAAREFDFLVAAGHIGHALHHNPMLTAPRVFL
jgi:hypothetical protein